MCPIVPMLQCGFVRLNLALPIAAASHEKEDHDLVQTLWQSAGAGDGNRTHIASLEGWSSTIELHPPVHSFSPHPALPICRATAGAGPKAPSVPGDRAALVEGVGFEPT